MATLKVKDVLISNHLRLEHYEIEIISEGLNKIISDIEYKTSRRSGYVWTDDEEEKLKKKKNLAETTLKRIGG